jgi:hypothetical protein
MIDAYVEGLKLHSVQEEAEQAGEFNASSANLTDAEVAAKSAALQLAYRALVAEPEPYLQRLTIGYLQLLDRWRIDEQGKKHDGNREKVEESGPIWSPEERAGKLTMFPVPKDHSLGKWSSPDFSFPEYNASASGLNTDSLKKLFHAEVQAVPVTMRFLFHVGSPYYRLWKGDQGALVVRFTRTAEGHVYLEGDAGDDAWEWLASYRSPRDDEYSESERETLAPQGANKLYEATKHTPIGEVDMKGF